MSRVPVFVVAIALANFLVPLNSTTIVGATNLHVTGEQLLDHGKEPAVEA